MSALESGPKRTLFTLKNQSTREGETYARLHAGAAIMTVKFDISHSVDLWIAVKKIGCDYYSHFNCSFTLINRMALRIFQARLKGILMAASKTWVSLGTVASPATGTLFTKILTQHNHKYILWYNSERLFKPGDQIKVLYNRLFVNDEPCDINILQVDKYSHTLWRVMNKMSSCPGHRDPESKTCDVPVKCIFKKCPYGKVRVN